MVMLLSCNERQQSEQPKFQQKQTPLVTVWTKCSSDLPEPVHVRPKEFSWLIWLCVFLEWSCFLDLTLGLTKSITCSQWNSLFGQVCVIWMSPVAGDISRTLFARRAHHRWEICRPHHLFSYFPFVVGIFWKQLQKLSLFWGWAFSQCLMFF